MTPLSVLQEEQKGRQAGLAVNRVGSGPDSRSATHWLGSILRPVSLLPHLSSGGDETLPPGAGWYEDLDLRLGST